MKPKHRRLWFLLTALTVLGAATALVLGAFNENLVFFFSPSEVQAKGLTPDRRFRLGGLVEEGSVVRAEDGMVVNFRVTDLEHTLAVRYRGLLPDMFREGQGVIAEGYLAADGVFMASEVLAKHDETYMPPEVAEALKRSGKWQGQGDDGAGAPDGT